MKRKCVLGVLKTEEGLRIKEEMIGWLNEKYDIITVEVDPPNDIEFEYPFIKKACEVAIESNEPVLYLHTKGAAMQNQAQPVVRDFWKHEFTEKADQYFNVVNSNKALASAPIVGSQNPICWFNGFVMNSSAAKQILEKLSVHDDRYWFEQQMLKESNVSTIGIYDSKAENGSYAWRSFCYYYLSQYGLK